MISRFRLQSNLKGWVIFCDDSSWQVANLESRQIGQLNDISYDSTQPTELATSIGIGLQELGYRHEPVLIALGSSWCVSASIPISTAGFSQKHDALGYLFESYVPLAAEDMVIDFDVGNSAALVVGIEIAIWKPLIDELERIGIRVESISPIARLGVEHFLRVSPGLPDKFHFLWSRGQSIEYWLIEEGHPSQWQWLLAEPCSFMQSVIVGMLNTSPKAVVLGVGFNEDQQAALNAVCDSTSCAYSAGEKLDWQQAVMEEAANVLAGKRKPSIELRRGGLKVGDRFRTLRVYIIAFQIVFLLSQIALCVSLWNRTRQNTIKTLAIDVSQQALFEQLFPKRRVPIGIRAQLQNEVTRLQGMRGEGGELPDTPESLEVLDSALRSLPENLRLRISEVRIEGERLSLYGQVREHSDAATVANELTKRGLSPTPPFTRRLKEAGFEFRISAIQPPAVNTEKSLADE